MKNKNTTVKKPKQVKKNSKDITIIEKSKNNSPIRILYKKTGRIPEVKIIGNVLKLKKAVIKKRLDIIPYETVYIICNNKKNQDKTKSPNIVLDFYSITGDLILVDIDKNKREFKGLSQEDVIWYAQDLINKSFNNNNANNVFSNSTVKGNRQKTISYSERGFENSNATNFEQALLQVLSNIELDLDNLSKSGGCEK